jgi:predicted transcriptional regulator
MLMNFSIYINDELGKKLQAIAEREHISRNNLINEAIARLIEEREANTWSEEVLNWSGCPEFELGSRDGLTAPKEEIF